MDTFNPETKLKMEIDIITLGNTMLGKISIVTDNCANELKDEIANEVILFSEKNPETELAKIINEGLKKKEKIEPGKNILDLTGITYTIDYKGSYEEKNGY